MKQLNKLKLNLELKSKGLYIVGEYKGAHIYTAMQMIPEGFIIHTSVNQTRKPEFSKKNKLLCNIAHYDSSTSRDNNVYSTHWSAMIRRCYDKNLQARFITRNYDSCTVCKEWLLFSTFEKWAKQQGDIQDLSLDKDILVENNTQYGPDTCVFVTVQINQLLKTNPLIRSKYGQGVHKELSGNFSAIIKINGKAKRLGTFKTKQEASNSYRLAKHKHINDIANSQNNIQIQQALLNKSLKYKD